MPATTCPSHDQLLAYSLGRLPDEASDTVAAHLSSCLDCRTGLPTLDHAEDTFLARLRRPATPDPYLDESQCQAALARARSVADGSSPAGRSSESLCGKALGEYQLIEELGHGGMGTVYKALHTKLDRVVAVKVLPRDRVGAPQAIARFEREMRAVGQLAHPNIVQAYDAREIDGTLVLVMEFVDGLDLAELVRRIGPLPIAEACELVRQTALGLQRAHEHGLVHRDIKPSNIMLARTGEVKLLDLGLARFYAEGGTGGRSSTGVSPVSSGEEMTGTGQAMGTADYMAPEQASDSRTVDIRADIYSLGCTLYKLLAGRAPFGGPEHRGTLDKMNAHVHESPPPIRQFAPEVPDDLAAILDRMLAKDPSDRFATPADVALALEPFCTGNDLRSLLTESPRHPVTLSPHHPSPAPIPRRPTIKTLLITLGFLGAIAAAFAAGVVITINRNGEKYQLEVPKDSRTVIDESGNPTVNIPGKPAAGTGSATAQVAQTPATPPATGVPISRPLVREISDYADFAGRIESAGPRVPESLRVTFEVDERTFLRLRRAARQDNSKANPEPDIVLCGFADEVGYPHRGKVVGRYLTLDPAKGTARWFAEIPNPDEIIVPGMSARVRLITSAPHKALLVAESAITSDQGQQFVFVANVSGEVDSNSVSVERRAVKLGQLNDGLRVVEEGLTADNWVLLSPPSPALADQWTGKVIPTQKIPMPLPSSSSQDGLSPPARAKPPAVSPAAELKALQGQWKVVRVEKGRDSDSSSAGLFGGLSRGMRGGRGKVRSGGRSSLEVATIDRFEFTDVYGKEQLFLTWFNPQTFPTDGQLWFDYRMDLTASPKTIDLLESVRARGGPGGPGAVVEQLRLLGIYEIEGDRLRISMARYYPSVTSDQRPKGFAMGPGSEGTLFVLERYRPSADVKAMMGSWTASTEVEDGKPVPEEKLRDRTCFFGDPSVSIASRTASDRALQGRYVLDGAKQPKTITITSYYDYETEKLQKREYLGIYKLDGGRLTIAYRQGGAAPEKFESPPGSGVTLLVLRKDEPDAGATGGEEAAKPKQVPGGMLSGQAVKLPSSPPTFRTATVTRGDVVATVSTTGTVEPEEVVDVGAKVAGQIVSLGDDPRGTTDPRYKGKPVDFDTLVEEGTILARIDDAIYKARVDQEKAACERAKAELTAATAEPRQPHVAVAHAAIAQSEAALKVAQISLDNTVIKSPIKGVILARRVNVGQNVGPDPKAASLFLIAKYPTKLQVWASVNEADIGRIHEGMEARFTVDAFPKETFKGKVAQMRLNAQMVQNVVLYTVVVTCDNADMKLRPYLTANLQFETASTRNVLRVPGEALRWKPQPDQVAPDAHGQVPAANDRASRVPRLWAKDKDGEHVRPVEVQVGLSDGKLTEVSGPDVKEGMEVVIGEGPGAKLPRPAAQTPKTPTAEAARY